MASGGSERSIKREAVTLTFGYGFVVADVRPQTGTRRRSLLQTQPVTGDEDDRVDDRGAADGQDQEDTIPELQDEVDLVEPIDNDIPLDQVDPDDLADVDKEVNEDLNEDVKKGVHVLANPRSYEFWEDTTICVVLMCLSSCISGLVRSPPQGAAPPSLPRPVWWLASALARLDRWSLHCQPCLLLLLLLLLTLRTVRGRKHAELGRAVGGRDAAGAVPQRRGQCGPAAMGGEAVARGELRPLVPRLRVHHELHGQRRAAVVPRPVRPSIPCQSPCAKGQSLAHTGGLDLGMYLCHKRPDDRANDGGPPPC